MRPTLLLLLAFICVVPVKDGLAASYAGYDLDTLDAYLEANLSAFSGNVAVYFYEGDTLIYDFEEVFDRNTRIPMASATKWIAGSVMLALEERGIYGLDDPIGRYVPSFDVPDKRDITIRQAFSMTSGLEPQTPLQNSLQRNPSYDLEQSVALIGQLIPVSYAPGSTIYYTGSGMQAAGFAAVLAYAAKYGVSKSWDEIADEVLFDPLGMANTGFTDFLPNPAIAGGVETTPDDYLKLLKMIHQNGYCDGKAVLTSHSVLEFYSAAGRDKPIEKSPFSDDYPDFPYGRQPYYSFGTWVLADNPATGEVEELTSPGAYGTFPWIDKRRGLWGIVCTSVPAGTQQAFEETMETFRMVQAEWDRLHPESVPALRIGEESSGWIDPEVRPGGNEIVFQDGERTVWAGLLNETSGDLIEGSLEVIDTNATPLLISWNGPEFIESSSGWSVIYNKSVNALPQLWKAEKTPQGWATAPLFTDNSVARTGFLTQRTSVLDDAWLIYLRDVAGESVVHAVSLGNLDEEIPVEAMAPQQPAHVQILADANAVLVSTGDEPNGSLRIFDLVTRQWETVFVSTESVSLPFSVSSPELGGGLLLGVVEGGSCFVFLAESSPGEWTEVATMEIPSTAADNGFSKLQSPEAFVFAGRSFVSFHIERPDTGVIEEAQMWAYAPDLTGHGAIQVRADSGEDPMKRTDPEFFVTADEVFLVYNIINDNFVYEIRRSRTGLGNLLQAPGSLTIRNLGGHLMLEWDQRRGATLEGSISLLSLDWEPIPSLGSPFLLAVQDLGQDSLFWHLRGSNSY